MCRCADVLAEVRERVRGRVGGRPRFLARRGLQTGVPTREGSQAPVSSTPRQRAIMSSVHAAKPVVGHGAELGIAISRWQRRAHRQTEPRQGRRRARA